jgi:hypothetical protein
MATNVTGWLSDEQLAMLRRHGEERTAEVGDALYRVSTKNPARQSTVSTEAGNSSGRPDRVRLNLLLERFITGFTMGAVKT